MNDSSTVQENNNYPVSENPQIVAAAEMIRARIQANYLVASKNRRNEDASAERIYSLCRNPSFANIALYKYPIRGKIKRDLSIRAAEAFLEVWGNIDITISVTYEDERHRRICAVCTDLQNIVSYTRELTINKTVERTEPGDRTVIEERKNSLQKTVYLVVCTEDELDRKEKASVSKAMQRGFFHLYQRCESCFYLAYQKYDH
ncbi:hypothetical protein LCGC14_2794300 [marine sediment metagenome]|uniref:Uncharacterized protein n=1 Tax=marine sediment metagenome TaxID=412755 RepID=A0A0F9BFZ5_9ZZZZ